MAPTSEVNPDVSQKCVCPKNNIVLLPVIQQLWGDTNRQKNNSTCVNIISTEIVEA